MEDILSLINSGVGAASSWKTAGAIAALSAIVWGLLQFSKTTTGQGLLKKLSAHHKWVRPLVANALGFLAGALGALALHKPWLTILAAGFAGIGASFAAIGAHESALTATAGGRERRAASTAIDHALTGDEAEVKEKVEALKVKLDAAVTKTGKAARLSAVAAWMRENRP